MTVGVATDAGLDQAADPGSYARAILNVLADFSEEKTRLADVQSAMLNILEDSGREKLGLEATQKATLNILADIDTEKSKVEQANREMAREIAERKRAERRVVERTAELEAANKELEAFSYSVSHDLRAPLRSVDGFSQALLEDYFDKLDEGGRDSLRRVRASTQRMAQLIDDLLNLSRLSRTELRPEPVDLSGLARTIATELRNTQPERDVEFEVAEGLVTRADGRLLRVALENLLANAWKFTAPHATARIEFGCEPQPDGGGAFFVRDDGVGFDMAYVDKLFGAFQRLHGSGEFAGTGIGLATVQRIIHRHGGRVWAQGEVGKGATFYFALEGAGNRR